MEKQKLLTGLLEIGAIDAQIAMLRACKDFLAGMITKDQFDEARRVCAQARETAKENRAVQIGRSEN